HVPVLQLPAFASDGAVIDARRRAAVAFHRHDEETVAAAGDRRDLHAGPAQRGERLVAFQSLARTLAVEHLPARARQALLRVAFQRCLAAAAQCAVDVFQARTRTRADDHGALELVVVARAACRGRRADVAQRVTAYGDHVIV